MLARETTVIQSQISTGFTYVFVDDQDEKYSKISFMFDSSDSFDLDINENTNETDSRLMIHEGNMKMKGFTLEQVG